MNLIENWKAAWKLLSVQANTVGIALTATYGALYDELKVNFPPKWMAILTAGVFVLGIVGRLISQTPKDDQK